jgi:hypothetical protein
LSLAKGIGESFRFAGLYTIYGMGYKSSYPLMGSGREPDSAIGKASLRAGNIINEHSCIPKEVGYRLSLWGVPGALVGEALYFLSGDGQRDAALE